MSTQLRGRPSLTGQGTSFGGNSAGARRFRARLAVFSRARRRVNALHSGALGLAAGGFLAAIVGSIAQVYGLNEALLVVIALLLGSTMIALLVGWLRPIDAARTAFDIDHALHLDERMTTALESAREKTSSGAQLEPSTGTLRNLLEDEQLADALISLDAARPGAVYPIRVARVCALAALAGLLLAALPWIIPWSLLYGGATPAGEVSATNQEQAARLEALARELDSGTPALDPAARRQLADQLRQAAVQLRRDGSNAGQASRDLLRTEQSAATVAPRTGEDAALTLARVADALNRQATTAAVTRALDAQNVAGASAAMDQIANNVGQMTPAQRDAVANALQSASSAASGSDTAASQQLRRAADAVRRGDPSGTRQASQAIQELGSASQAQNDAARVQSEVETSRQAVRQAAEASTQSGSSTSRSSHIPSSTGSSAQLLAGSPNGTSSNPPTGNGSPSSGSSNDGAGNGSSGSSGGNSVNSGNPNGNGTQNGEESGSGYGQGSTEHLGNPSEISSLAQRQVVVPTDPNAPLAEISPSGQSQVGASSEARVDYQTVLPQYQKQALEGLDNGAVPNDLRNVVKGYFDALASK